MLKHILLTIVLLKIASSQQIIDDGKPRVYYPGLCDQTNCRYGDCEIINSTYIKCHCVKGVTGTNCDRLETTGNPCGSYPCYGASTCYALNTGSYICVCPPDRTGINCESNVGTCACKNGGVCTQTAISAFTCQCPSGFGGNLCEINLSTLSLFCLTKTCLNGGFCQAVNSTTGFCVCPVNYFGSSCEIFSQTTIAPATTAPSTQAPTVPTTQASTASATSPPFAVTTCTLNICVNGGSCYLINNANVLCVCTAQYQGQRCEVPTTTLAPPTSASMASTAPTTVPPIQSCPPNITICQNGGICLIVNGGTLTCKCPTNFIGLFCEIPATTAAPTAAPPTTQPTTALPVIQPCPTSISICENGGTCSIVNSNINCKCLPDFTGTFCENKLPFCSNNPCQNNGNCQMIDAVKGVCVCPAPFGGIYCESIGCTPNPCKNGQQCFPNKVNQPTCLCASIYGGSYCEIIL